MLFGLETVEIMAVAALTSRYVKSSNARLTYVPRYLWSDVYFRFVIVPWTLNEWDSSSRRVIVITTSEFSILSSTRLDSTLYNKYSFEEPCRIVSYRIVSSNDIRRILRLIFFFLLREERN